MMEQEFRTHVFPNGLRLIHAWMPREASHCALAIQAGTRNEAQGEAGWRTSSSTPCSKAHEPENPSMS